MARFCTNCGNPMQEGHSFCENCGAPVEGAPAAVDVASESQVEAAAADQAPSIAADDASTAQPEAQMEEAFEAQEDSVQAFVGRQGVGYDPRNQDAFSDSVGFDDGFRPAPTGPIFNAGMAKKASGLAIASLVLGIISIVTSLFVVGVVFGIVAIVLFAVARKKSGKSGIGLAGLITGIVGTVISLLMAAVICFSVFALGAAYVGADDIADADDSATYDYGTVDDTALVGMWRLDGVYNPDSIDESEYSVLDAQEAKALEAAGDSAKLTISDDNTFVLRFGSYSKTGTWAIDGESMIFECNENGNGMWGFFYNDGDSVDYAEGMEFDEISIVDGGNIFIFERWD